MLGGETWPMLYAVKHYNKYLFYVLLHHIRRNKCVVEWIYVWLFLHLDAPMILGVKSLLHVDKHMIWWIWSLPGNLTTTKPLIKWCGKFQYESPLFGRLDPPIVAKPSKKRLHNHCVYIITWYLSATVRRTVAYSDHVSIVIFTQMTRFTNTTWDLHFWCPWSRPW